MPVEELAGWSAFPSDHATLYFCLAAGLWFCSSRMGWFAGIYVALVICLPRVYLGLHWPTDILGGALLGVGMAQLARWPALRDAVGGLAARWHKRQPGSFLAALFLWSYLVATNFDEPRFVAAGLWRYLHRA
jgi:undecaprenyl-diphosphatase